jgi:hypothetical protein
MTISSERWRYDGDLPSQFRSPAAGPFTCATVDLDVSDIEDAGIREVLQTPSAAYGAWSILDALLTPTGTGTPFIFGEPLGQAREMKVALSDVFGRFVARAYLERNFNLSNFAHLGSRIIDLDRRRQVKITRLYRGDLPTGSAGIVQTREADIISCRRANPPICTSLYAIALRDTDGPLHPELDEFLLDQPAWKRVRKGQGRLERRRGAEEKNCRNYAIAAVSPLLPLDCSNSI